MASDNILWIWTYTFVKFHVFSILSFGAPQNNIYKIIVEGKGAMVFETNQVRIKIRNNNNAPMLLCELVIRKLTYFMPSAAAVASGTWADGM